MAISEERARALGLARAALALVGVDVARARELLTALVEVLAGDLAGQGAEVVSLAAERAKRHP